jgi:hypothetical protein
MGGRNQGAERTEVGRPQADDRGSFIEQIGGARTKPSRRLVALASFSARCNFNQVPPDGSILSRAPISGATPFD